MCHLVAPNDDCLSISKTPCAKHLCLWRPDDNLAYIPQALPRHLFCFVFFLRSFLSGWEFSKMAGLAGQ